MIVFKSIELKNFFSVGDTPITINLDGASPVLVSGSNGAGKSVCVVDSICWVLFNKPYRKVNKSEILNKINEKNCLVKIYFDIGKDQYHVVRGIKPNIFEIYKNGALIDQSSNAKDYQKILEENILRLNYESFKQVVILSSSQFIPFMELTPATRRIVVEDILDIEVFSKMKSILSQHISTSKSDIHLSDMEIVNINSSLKSIEDMMDNLNKDYTDIINNKQSLIEECEKEILSLEKSISKKKDAVGKARDIFNYKKTELERTISSANNRYQYIMNDMKKIDQEIKSTKEWFNCNTCGQPIDDTKRDTIISDLKNKLTGLVREAQDNKQEAETKETELKSLLMVEAKIREDEDIIHNVTKNIDMNNFKIQNYKDEIVNIKDSIKTGNSLKSIEAKKKEFETQYKEANTNFKALNMKLKYQNFIADILKDDGIKAKAISQYLPIINERVNKYLETLSFFGAFSLDENFNETIRARHRDPQVYSSLSQGEKQRIDLSLLFTWRDVARIKNSINTNILILDETFDSSLDNDGIDNLLSILEIIQDNTKIFVISHKAALLEDKIDNHLVFEKKNNFTTVRNSL